MKSYLTFEQIPSGMTMKRKTKVFDVNVCGDSIGTVKWNNNWRQYCFYPSNDMMWSHDCLIDVFWFLYGLMREREK